MLRLVAATLTLLFSIPQRAVDDDKDTELTRAIAALENSGAIVQPVAAGSTLLTVNFAIAGNQAGDADLAPLAKLPTVIELNLGKTRITDQAATIIASLASLRRLALHETAIGDAALALVAKLAHLESLNLYGTKITDAGLEHLAKLSSLRRLYLWRTAVTKDGAARLQSALPDLKIDRGAEPLPKPEPKAEPKTCCEKAKADGKACEHPCCIAAAKDGKICAKCNPHD